MTKIVNPPPTKIIANNQKKILKTENKIIVPEIVGKGFQAVIICCQ